MTPDGIKPWKKIVDAILNMDGPKNDTDVGAFIGAVNHCKSLWPRRAHTLGPSAALTGKGKFHWSPDHERSFKEMKAIIVADAINAFPDCSIPFDVYTDASDFQLGAAIIQNGRPMACHSKKLTPAQQNCTTTEKELLGMAMTLKEHRKMLAAARIRCWTDHKNLTFKTF